MRRTPNRSWWSYPAIGIGALLVVGAVVVRTAGVPLLERFPLNIDETAHYAGVALTSIDPATGAPITPPRQDPLTIDRRVHVLRGNLSKAVVEEDVTIRYGTTTTEETYQFVMDRRTMKFVQDPRQFAFDDPSQPIHASGTYRVNFAMGTRAGGSYQAFIVETDSSAPLTLVRGRHFHADAGMSVIDFSSRGDQPVAPYYLAHLKSEGLPMSLTAAQVQAQLTAAGIDVAKALADVGPRLTPAEAQVVSDTLSKPVPLKYSFFTDGMISIEPRTGALVDVHANSEGIAISPDLSGAAPLVALLDKYSTIPSVQAVSQGLSKLAAAPPTTALTLQYQQTPASSREVGNKAKSQIRQMNLLEKWVPGGLLLAGLLLGVVGIVGRRRPTPGGIAATGTEPTVPVKTAA